MSQFTTLGPTNMTGSTTANISFEITTTTLPPPEEGNMGLVLNESISTVNMQPIEVVPVVAAGIVFGTLVAIGTIATLIFIAVLIRGRRRFAEFPFFVIVWHLTAANVTHMFMVISTIMPVMLLEIGDDTPKREWYIWGSRILDLTEQGALYFTLLITINRFAVFVVPKLLVLFTFARAMILCILTWAYIVFIVTWNVCNGATKNFSKKKLGMEESLLGNNLLSKFFTLSSTVLPFVMLAMYGIIFAVIIKKRSLLSASATSSDRSLLWQALAITLMLELTKLTSMITPYMSETDSWVQWCWTIFNYSTSIMNQMSNPVLFLTMNKMVRSVLRNFFRTSVVEFNSDPSHPQKNDPPVRLSLLQRIGRTLLKSKRMLTGHHPVTRNTWVPSKGIES
ncbi:hypothetical protein Q1695_012742 [Nippostrongylus brasiliensis]|nr:hypothetical protein Q1695_012742 [Nippostrongylus brasiliensis]